MDDMELLRRYAEDGDQASFQELVSRHLNWVFSTCQRQVRNRHLAEDAAQAVFIILARKAKSIHPDTLLTGWLFRTARFAAADAMKKETRYKRHTERAAQMSRNPQTSDDTDKQWGDVSPKLDEAVACLTDTDRQAVLLRFFEGKSLAQVGECLGITEEAAKKRVSRAVDRLRIHLKREGVAVTAVALVSLMLVRGAQAAPAALAASATAVATGTATASSTSLALAQGAMALMKQASAQLLAAVLAAAVALGIGTGLVAVYRALAPVQPAVASAPHNVADNTAAPQKDLSLTLHSATPPAAIANSLPPSLKLGKLEGSTQHAPSIDEFARVWVTRGSQVVWQFDSSADAGLPSMKLDLVTKAQASTYVVAQDQNGTFWLHRVPQAAGDNVVSAVHNASLAEGYVSPAEALMNAIRGDDSLIRGATGPAGWSPVPNLSPDTNTGNIVIEDINSQMRMNLFNGSGGLHDFQANPKAQTVPEPGTLALLAAASAVGLLARRRR